MTDSESVRGISTPSSSPVVFYRCLVERKQRSNYFLTLDTSKNHELSTAKYAAPTVTRVHSYLNPLISTSSSTAIHLHNPSVALFK